MVGAPAPVLAAGPRLLCRLRTGWEEICFPPKFGAISPGIPIPGAWVGVPQACRLSSVIGPIVPVLARGAVGTLVSGRWESPSQPEGRPWLVVVAELAEGPSSPLLGVLVQIPVTVPKLLAGQEARACTLKNHRMPTSEELAEEAMNFWGGQSRTGCSVEPSPRLQAFYLGRRKRARDSTGTGRSLGTGGGWCATWGTDVDSHAQGHRVLWVTEMPRNAVVAMVAAKSGTLE